MSREMSEDRMEQPFDVKAPHGIAPILALLNRSVADADQESLEATVHAAADGTVKIGDANNRDALQVLLGQNGISVIRN